MPNHVLTEMTLVGVPLSKVSSLILDDGGLIDFNILLPLPINFWAGSVGLREERAFPGNRLDAATATWGTKWNAYGQDEVGRYKTVREEDGSTILTFQTAWSHPRGWTVALFNTLECRIEVKWFDEGRSDANLEIFDYQGSEGHKSATWTEGDISEGSVEHRRLHKLLWALESFDDEEAA